MAERKWEAWEAYTTGNRKEIGVHDVVIDHEPINNGGEREYLSATMNDGNYYIIRPGHPQYEEIKSQATKRVD